jgi:rare lipoprotein A
MASVIAASPSFTARRLAKPIHKSQSLLRAVARNQAFAFTVCALSVSGVATAAAVFSTVQHLHSAQVQPLAPARPPASAADMAVAIAPKRQHRLHTFAMNQLRGVASWYGSVLHGHTTASGEVFDEAQMTACHRTLPFGTMVRVTDTASQRSVVVRINDRGVLNADRVIDLSSGAAQKLGILRSGLASVRLEVLKVAAPGAHVQSTESN